MDYPGYAGTTDMFSKQNQPNQSNSVDAREAVKKQLLRSLMQQVVDEVSSLGEADFNDMVKSMVADIDTSSLRARVEKQIEASFEDNLQKLDLDSRMVEHEEKLSASVQEHVNNRVGSIATDIIKVQLADINLHSIQQDLEAQTRQILEERFATIDLDEMVESNKKDMFSQIEDSLQQRTSAIFNSLADDFNSNFKEKLELFEEDAVKAISDELEDKIDETKVKWAAQTQAQLESAVSQAKVEAVSRAENAIITGISSIDFDSILESNKDEVIATVTQGIEEKTQEISAELLTSLQSDFNRSLVAATQKASDSVSGQMADHVISAAQQWNEQCSDKLESDLARVQAEITARIEETVERDASNLRNQVEQIIEAGFEKNLESANLESTITEQKAKLLESVAIDLNSRVQAEADAIIESQLSTFDVAPIQNELDAHVNQLVSEKVQAIDLDEIIESNKVKIVTEVDETLKTKAEAVSAGLIKSITANFNKKLATVSKASSTELTQTLSQFVEEALKKDAPTTEVVVANATQSILKDKNWIETATNRVTTALSTNLGSVVQKNVENSSQAIEAAVELVRQDADLIESLIEKIKTQVVEQISNVTLSELSDSNQTAKDAAEHFAYDDDTLIAAVGILRTNVLQDVALRALVSFGDAENVQKDASKWVNEEDSYIQMAVAEINKTASNVISVLVHQQMSDTDALVRKIAPEFTADSIQIRNAVKATRQELIARITDIAVSELAQTDKVASDSAALITDDHDAVQKAVRLTVSKMVDEVISLTETRLYCTDRISEEARGRMAKDIPTVVQAADVLENMLLAEVASYATKRLYEVGLASEKASSFLKADKEIEAVRKALMNSILESIAHSSAEDLADTKALAKRAFHKVDMDNESVEKAIEQVRIQLVTEIAEAASSRIVDIASVAKESRLLIPSTNSNMTSATNRVYDMLVEEVAEKSLAFVSESDKTASLVLGRIQEETEVINRVQEIVHDQMIERLLAHALQEIKDKVSDGSHEAEKAFFKNSMRVFAEPSAASRSEQPAPSSSVEPAPSSSVEPAPSSSVEPAAMAEASIPSEDLPLEPAAEATIAEEMPSHDTVDWTLLSDINEPAQDEVNDAEDHLDLSSSRESVNESSPSSSTPSTEKSWSVTEFTTTTSTVESFPAGDGSKGTAPKFADVQKSISEPTFYMYGIVSTNQVADSMFAGIEGLQERSVVYSLPCGNLTAIVSKLTDPAFSPYMIRKSMRDNNWLKDQVRHHAGVLSEAKGLMTIIPLRFGTVFNSENGIRRFVELQRSKMMETLSRLQDKSEFGICVLCDADRLRASGFGKDDAFETSLHELSPEVADFIRAQSNPQQSFAGGSSLDSAMANMARRIHAPLNEMASEAVSKDMPIGYSTSGSNVILNATYLVPVVGEKNFRARVTTLAQEMRDSGITIEVSGPWPPYHFVDVDMGGSEEYFSTEIPA